MTEHPLRGISRCPCEDDETFDGDSTWCPNCGSDFCECGVTLLDGEDECATCAGSPHGRECECDECSDYWERVCRDSKEAAERANRALVCSCGWTGAFIEHHNSEAYGPTARVGCEITHRCPAPWRKDLVRKAWTGTEWRQVKEPVQ